MKVTKLESVEIVEGQYGILYVRNIYENGSVQEHSIFPTAAEALRNHFQQERDQELGRWRDPKNPDLVCYQRGDDTVYVLDERKGIIYARTRSDIIDGSDQYDIVAYRYFQAHPTPEPKPWEKARPGEIWVLTIDGGVEAWRLNEYGTWTNTSATVCLANPSITAGRRIWPEEDK